MTQKDTFGVMLDCSRNAVMKPEQVKKFAKIISAFGYNSVQLYTEDTYEIESEPYFGYLRGRYTKDEIKDIDAYCNSIGVELIPCIQTLAHLNQIFRWSKYAPVNDTTDILLVGEEKTYELIDKMFAFLAESFTSRRVNIGMDEAHMLGRGAYLDKHGLESRFKIIKSHLDRVLEIAKKYGFRCMMWSDMFMRIQNGGEYYSYNVNPSEECKKSVPENLDLIYWDYYHTDKKMYDSMFDSHKVLSGDNVWFAGGVWTWVGFAPRNGFSIKAMKPAVKSAAHHNVKNIFITMWGDDGKECSFYAVLPSLFTIKKIYDGETDMAVIKSEFKKIVGIDYDAMMLLDLPSDAGKGKNTTNNPCRYMLYNDPVLGILDPIADENYVKEFKSASRKLAKYSKDGEFAYIFNCEKLLCDVLALKCDLGVKLRAAYKADNKDELKALALKIKKIEKALDNFYYAFRKLWYTENKPHGFDVQDIRLGGLSRRLKSARERIEAYVSGEISDISELEENLIDPICREEADKNSICYQGYRVNSTVNVL